MLYELLKPVVGVALHWYYRSIFANPLVARLLHTIGVVPLRRASDERQSGAPAASDAGRNAASFDAVATALAAQGAIVIFPEGKSHDLPQLAPLRTGLARMTLQAYQAHGVGGTLSALLEPTPSVTEGTPSLGRVLELLRRLDRVQGTLRARDNADLQARLDGFEMRVRTFRTRLDAQGIDPHDLAISAEASAGIRFAVREAMLAMIAAPVGLWGRITHFVPIQLARRLALRNVQALDEPAMRTLVVGLVLVLTAYVVQTAIVASLAGGWWALGFLLTLVPSASSDLQYGDRTRRAGDRARAYFTFRRDPLLQGALLAEADAIRQDAFALERLAADR